MCRHDYKRYSKQTNTMLWSELELNKHAHTHWLVQAAGTAKEEMVITKYMSVDT